MDKQPHEFFRLNVTYQIAQGANPDALLDDVICLTSIVTDGLSALAMNIDTSAGGGISNERGLCQLLHGLSYLADMAGNAAGAAQMELMAKEQGARHD